MVVNEESGNILANEEPGYSIYDNKVFDFGKSMLNKIQEKENINEDIKTKNFLINKSKIPLYKTNQNLYLFEELEMMRLKFFRQIYAEGGSKKLMSFLTTKSLIRILVLSAGGSFIGSLTSSLLGSYSFVFLILGFISGMFFGVITTNKNSSK